MALLICATGLVAAGIASEVALSEQRRRRRAALHVLATQPEARAQLRSMQALEEHSLVPMMVVQVDSAHFGPRLANSKLQACLKVGQAGHSMRHISQRVRVGPTGEADFQWATIFPWRPESFSPVVRLRLIKAGLIDTVVSKEELWLPSSPAGVELQCGMQQEVMLFDQSLRKELLGQLRMTVQVQRISVAELRRCGLLRGWEDTLVYAPETAYAVAPVSSAYRRRTAVPAAAVSQTPSARLVAGHIVRPTVGSSREPIVAGRLVGDYDSRSHIAVGQVIAAGGPTRKLQQ